MRLLNFQLGVDSYTSASSDKIDPATISSASKSDRRIYPSVTYNIRNNEQRRSVGFIGYFSKEYDYISLSPGINFTKSSKDNSREFSVKLQAFFDNWKIILPIELRTVPNAFTTTSRRNSFNNSFTFSQIINKRTQFATILDLAYQSGLLSTPFHRVYFVNNALRVEKLPDTRFKLPLGFRLNYFLGDRIVIRSIGFIMILGIFSQILSVLKFQLKSRLLFLLPLFTVFINKRLLPTSLHIKCINYLMSFILVIMIYPDLIVIWWG